MSVKDGGPAFPRLCLGQSADGANEVDWSNDGMSLRDYFAVTLLAGDANRPGEGCDEYMAQRARVAYAYADAMLTAREQ